MAVHPLWPAFWHPTDVCLDCAGWLFGNRPSVVSAELYYWRSDRRFRSGLAADRGGVVCAADGVEIDSWMTTLKTQTGGVIPSGFLIIPCPQKNHMHFLC